MSSDDEGESGQESLLSKNLEKLYDELTDLTVSTYKIYKVAKQMRKQDLYTSPFTLNTEASKYFKKEKMSVEEILDIWIPKWRAENRIGLSGKTIRPAHPEATLLHLHPEEPVDVYDLCKRVIALFSVPH